jgi:hypothetical protein
MMLTGKPLFDTLQCELRQAYKVLTKESLLDILVGTLARKITDGEAHYEAI